MRALYVGRPYSKQTFARFVLGIPIFGNFDTVVSRQVAQHRLSLTRAHHCKADIRIPEKALIDGTVIAIDVNDPAGHMLAIEHFAKVSARNQAARPRLTVQKAALLLFASVDCGNPHALLLYADRIAIDDAGSSGNVTRPLFSSR
jgi:hypothetical protein